MRRYFKVFLLLFPLFISACSPSKNHLPGGLRLEEHKLIQAPTLEPLIFQPVNGMQEEILAKHESERVEVTATSYVMIDENPALTTSWGGNELTAVVFTNPEKSPEQTVRVFTQNETLFETSAGMPSPILPLQGIWTYGRHWVLEILYATPEIWTGQIFIDGILINQDKKYDEAFGFQLLADKPFFFYQRSGQIGISYDGQEADLGYDQVEHYRCCAESILNPIPAENMVAFFAQRGETWYYVELGNFK